MHDSARAAQHACWRAQRARTFILFCCYGCTAAVPLYNFADWRSQPANLFPCFEVELKFDFTPSRILILVQDP